MLTVPDKTIAFYPIMGNEDGKEFDGDVSIFLKPANENHERNWFTPHFYKCLPLSIGNMQGFIFSTPIAFTVIWNGGDDPSDLEVIIDDDTDIDKTKHNVNVISLFGKGIITLSFPLILKTPEGVNLMTISPPNFPLPGLSPMTGVVESDNLNFQFTLNLKVDLVNAVIKIPKGTPLIGILPIPRYFCDSFKLVSAYDLFNEEDIEKERKLASEHLESRRKQTDKADRLYYRGMDIKGKKFKDHQLPRKQK